MSDERKDLKSSGFCADAEQPPMQTANQLPPTLTIHGRRPYLRDYGGGYLRIVDTPGFDVKTEWLGGDGKWHCTLQCPKPNQWSEAAALEFVYLHADLPEGFAIIKHREAGRDVCTLERRGANGLSSVSPLSVKDAYESAWKAATMAVMTQPQPDAPPAGLDLPNGPGLWFNTERQKFSWVWVVYVGTLQCDAWCLPPKMRPTLGSLPLHELDRGGWRAVAEGEARMPCSECGGLFPIGWLSPATPHDNACPICRSCQRAEAAERREIEAMQAVEFQRQARALQSQLSGVQGALADAGDVLAQREDGDYGASVRQVVEKLTAAEAELAEARKERDRWRAACNNRVAADQIAALTKERDTLQFEFRDLARLLLTEGPGDPLAKEIAGWTVKQCTDRITAGWEAALERERVLRELVASAKGGIVYLANVALIDASARESWHEWNRKAIAALAQTAQPAEPGAQ